MMRVRILSILTLALGSANTALAVNGVNFSTALSNTETGAYVIKRGLFPNIFAKEVCSCLYVDHLTLDQCKARDNLPDISHNLVVINQDPLHESITTNLNPIASELATYTSLITGSPPSLASYDANPLFGCTFVVDPPMPEK